MLDSIVGGLAIVLVCYALIYFCVSLAMGIRAFRREQSGLGDQALHHRYAAAPPTAGVRSITTPFDSADIYFLIPCLNEQAVITTTVRELLSQHPSARLFVIDDHSDDNTADLARAAGGERVRIVRRRLPDARRGKGQALNAGLRVVEKEVAERGLDASRVIVGVVDADGRLSVGATERIAAVFDADPGLGAVQLAVRIRNRDRLLTRFQDFEFWAISAVLQMGRKSTGSVGLGGNGQFSRLSALQSLDGDPWSESLTEDLDLGISLLIAGWRLSTTTDASVDQQALHSIGPLLRQRTRWFQGHMMCGKRIGELWFSPNLTGLAALGICLNLLVPWLLLLVWSVLIHIVYYRTAVRWSIAGSSLYGTTPLSIVSFVGVLYFLSFFPNIILGLIYWRRDPDVSLARGLFYGHFAVVVNYLYYFACWRAFIRILMGRGGWAKTARSTEVELFTWISWQASGPISWHPSDHISWRAPARALVSAIADPSGSALAQGPAIGRALRELDPGGRALIEAVNQAFDDTILTVGLDRGSATIELDGSRRVHRRAYMS